MLSIKDLCVSAGSKSGVVEILRGVDLDVSDNEFIVVTGPNGGGKTTLAKAIMGIMPAEKGSIVYNGTDITNMSITDRARLGVSFGFQQPPRFKGLTVNDLITLSAGRKLPHNETCSLLNTVGLCAKDYLGREVGSDLSGGEIKRIEIATVLARNSSLMIFDEPEAGIDIWSFTKLTETFGAIRGKSTIIIISHQERIINMADRVVLIKNGVIDGVGTPQELMPKIIGTTVYTCNVLSKKN
ncbi:MAG: ATP-binding cassette domain-containing protein [Clostridia bacterium]|nr:ATP-binding cassette domain-containing protein [Clostridia bacterium]